jgi:hypothetical protein
MINEYTITAFVLGFFAGLLFIYLLILWIGTSLNKEIAE